MQSTFSSHLIKQLESNSQVIILIHNKSLLYTPKWLRNCNGNELVHFAEGQVCVFILEKKLISLMRSQRSLKAKRQRRICAGCPPSGSEMVRDEGSCRSDSGTWRLSAGSAHGLNRLALNSHTTSLNTRTFWVCLWLLCTWNTDIKKSAVRRIKTAGNKNKTVETTEVITP